MLNFLEDLGLPHFRTPPCLHGSKYQPWSRTDSIWHWPAPSAAAASERDVRGEVQRAVERGGLDGGAQHE